MKTQKTPLLGLIAAILALALTACEQPTDDPPAPTLTGILAVYNGPAVSQNTPLNYLKMGLTVIAQYSNNTSKTLAPADYALSGTLAVGTSTIIVTYGSKADTFTVTVSNKTLTGITLNAASVKKAYSQNEQLDLTGLLVTANYSDSSSAPVAGYTSSPVNGATLSTTGQITVTVSYTEGELTRTAGFIVNVGGPAHVHQWGGWVITTPATETQDGEETRTCATCGEEETRTIVAFNHIHQWGGWTQTRVPTEIQDGEETRICSLNAAHQETRTAYATGTAGLAYELSVYFPPGYRVSKGTATSASTIHIPAYHRPNADSDYLPVTEIGNGTDSENSNAFGGIRYSSEYTAPNTTLTAVTFAENSQLQFINSYAFYYCTSLASVNIPAGVTSIHYYAFYRCTSLASVTIPANVTTIYSNVFGGCTSLTSVTIGEGVTYIGIGMFSGCSNLTNITIPASVTSIGDSAFSGCGLTSIIIPEGVTTIGNYVFSGTSLTTVTFAAGSQLKTIGERVFSGCTSLTSITIPNSVTSIGDEAFYYCTSLASVNIPASVTSIGEEAFSHCTSLTSINIPEGVTFIGNSAFFYCTSLASINIPEGVAYIGNSAFSGCSLTSINIPASVTSIGNNPFQDCTSLTGITVAANNTTYASQDGIMYNKAKTQLIIIPQALSGNVTIPEGVTSIGYAFYNRTGLTGITLPEGVTYIGGGAFYGCTGLTSINIPASVTNIGQAAFSGSYGNPMSLTTVIFAEGSQLQTIGDEAFRHCTSLTEITIPAGVTYINTSTFENCTGLASVTIGEGVATISASTFSSCTSLASITVAANNTTYASQDGILYNKAKTRFSLIPPKLSGNVTIPEGITSIDNNAFYNCTSLTSITIPASVTSIGNLAFFNCVGLTSVTFAEVSQLATISNGAFRLCTSLSSITIPAGYIDGNAFYGCTGLTSVTIGEGVTSISNTAFQDCTSFASITVAANNTTYASQDGILYNKAKTRFSLIPPNLSGNVTISTSLTTFDYVTFNGRTGLTGITIPASVTTIGNNMFNGCTGLTSVTIAEGVMSIGDTAFQGCTSLTGITLPASIATIGNNAFNGCTSLRDIIIDTDKITNTTTDNWGTRFPATNLSVTFKKNVGVYAFYSNYANTRLTSVTIAEGVTSIGSSAFHNCTSLTDIIIDTDTVTNTTTDNWGTRFPATNLSVTFNKNIGNNAFYNCTQLTSVTISAGVTSIGNTAFSGCTGLTSVTCLPTTPPTLGTDVFNNAPTSLAIKVPSASVTAYRNATNWSSYSSRISAL